MPPRCSHIVGQYLPNALIPVFVMTLNLDAHGWDGSRRTMPYITMPEAEVLANLSGDEDVPRGSAAIFCILIPSYILNPISTGCCSVLSALIVAENPIEIQTKTRRNKDMKIAFFINTTLDLCSCLSLFGALLDYCTNQI
jgi:hypothetical protein